MKRAAYTLMAVFMAIAAFAAAPKTLIVTLNNGTKTAFNVSEIANLTFGDAPIPVAPATTGPYAVGDFYSDGISQGIVVTVDPKGNYGTMVAVTDFPDKLEWSTVYEVTGANDTEDGRVNMATIAAIDPYYENYPAFQACADLGADWYLPAQKELQTLRGVLDKVNPTLESMGFEPVDTEAHYWSSSECDSFMDAMAFTADMDFPGMFGQQKQLLFPVRAFSPFGTVPEPNFTVGKVYEKDGVKGLIYWVSDDDSYARIIALDETKATYGALGRTIGARSTSDGEKNLKAAKAADASLAAYPAFKACADKGDMWYLPSTQELKEIAAAAQSLNESLTAAGATPLTFGYYWSSTEFTADADNSAVAVSLTDSGELGSSKTVERAVRAIAFVGERPEAPASYTIGDLYYEGTELAGIVFEVSEDGQHGKILALTNEQQAGRVDNAIWDKRNTTPLIGASSTSDGEANMAAARAADPELSNLPAFAICAAKGDGWYLPALDEMTAIANLKATLNPLLTANGGKAIATGTNDEYWTSTESPRDTPERVYSVKPVDGSNFDYRKYFYLKVRPVKKF